MNKKLFLAFILLFSLYLTGCAQNKATDNNLATKNQRNMTNVNNPTNRGPAITPARNNGLNDGGGITDVNNPDLNRNDNLTNIDNDNNLSQRTKMRLADKAADRVADLPEVDSATVMVTDNNAYVAARLDRSSRNELTSDIENKISKRVKSVDRDINNVYVSVNPDFYDRMNTYAGDIRGGKPISGFADQFADTIRRVFPHAR